LQYGNPEIPLYHLRVLPRVGGSDVMMVSGKVGFDALSRAVKQIYLISELKDADSTGNGAFNPDLDTTSDPTRMGYDLLDRYL
jgi:hypothetical protein